jgi:probable HAF family extracellular repeat protein
MSSASATGCPRWLFLACLAALFVPTAAAFADGVSFRGLGPDSSYAMGVSPDGSVVVGRGNASIGSKGYRWSADAGLTPIGVAPGDVHSEADGASTDGAVIVGASSDAGANRYTPFRWTEAAGIQPLGTIAGGGSRNIAVDVSADGAVIAGNAGALPWRWTASGGMVGLDSLPGQIEAVTRAISDDGSTIVGAGKTSHGGVAFRWSRAGGMQDLGDLPGASVSGSARAVNGD